MPSAWKQGLEHHRSSPERWMSKRGNGKRLSTKLASRWSEVVRRLRLIGSGHTDVRRDWHIAKFCCNAKLGRYRGKADIEQTAFHSIWLPTRQTDSVWNPAV